METIEAFPLVHKGWKTGSYDYKDQLLIIKMKIEHCKSKHHNMKMGWINYKKAFNNVPHSWIIKASEPFKISL